MLANVSIMASDPSLTDDTIISRVLLGKTEEYEILVRRYNNMLYKAARSILTKETDIEDAMQEAYLKGFEKLHQFRKEAKFSTWLTRILINCALQRANSLKKEFLDIDELDENAKYLQEEQTESSREEIEVNLKKALEGAIDHLPSKYRIVFILREVENTSVADTALALGISEENVKIRLHRAKGMLKEILRTELKSLEIFEFLAPRCAALAERVMAQIFATQLLITRN